MVCDCGVTWTDWATLATSAGTVVLAVVAWYQARQAKSQIEQTRSQIKQTDSQIELGKGQLEIGRGQLEAAQEASRAAADVHRESIRARADQFAPRISVHYGAVSGPYYSSTRMSRTQRSAEVSEENMTPAAGMQFVLPRDGESYIWFYGRALIVNHGDTDARVRLPGEAHFIAGRSALSGQNVELPSFLEAGLVNEAVLAPGQHALFHWSEGKPVSEWAKAAEAPGEPLPEGSIWLWTVVFDARDFGTIDTLMGHFKPELLAAVDGSTGVWKVKDSTIWNVAPLPSRRGYRSEGAFAADLGQMYEYHEVNEHGRSTKNGEGSGVE